MSAVLAGQWCEQGERPAYGAFVGLLARGATELRVLSGALTGACAAPGPERAAADDGPRLPAMLGRVCRAHIGTARGLDWAALARAPAWQLAGHVPLGGFAAVIWDAASGRLRLLRDRAGIKSLYYAVLADRVVFGFELRGVAAALPRLAEPDAGAVLQALQNEFAAGSASTVAGVRRVPPGTCVEIDRSLAVREAPYWQAAPATLADTSLDALGSRLDELFVEAVRDSATTQAGVALSGGLDSALLVAHIRRCNGAPLHTFSVGYEGARDRDIDGAQRIAGLFDTQHHELRLSGVALRECFARTSWVADELILDPALLPMLHLAEAAREHVDVLACGEGGDDVFAGCGRHRRHALQYALSGLLVPGTGGYHTRGAWSVAQGRTLFGPRLRALHPHERLRELAAVWRTTTAYAARRVRQQLTDLAGELPYQTLPKAERTLAASGIRLDVPYLHPDIVGFGIGLPERLKVAGGIGKWFLRHWGAGWLPADHVWRRKRGFHVPLRAMFPPDYVRLMRCVLPRHAGLEGWFEAEGVRELLLRAEHDDRALGHVYCIFHFALWQRWVVHGDGSAPPRRVDPLDTL